MPIHRRKATWSLAESTAADGRPTPSRPFASEDEASRELGHSGERLWPFNAYGWTSIRMIAPDHEQHAHHSRPEHRLELKLDVEARSHLRPHFLCQRGRAIEVPHARIIVIAVKDPAIASVAEHLRGHLSKGSIVLHTAGGLGTAIMEAYHQRLFAHGGRLYVGGLFAGLGGVVSQSLIAHDGEGWIAMGDTSGLGLAGAASELAVGDPECGLYTLNLPASSTSDGAVHRLGADGWRALAGERPAGVICSQLAVSAAGDVYLGCQTPFESRPLTPPMPRLYRHDGDRWVPLDFIPDVTEGTLVDMVFDPEGRRDVGRDRPEWNFDSRELLMSRLTFELGLLAIVIGLGGCVATIPDDRFACTTTAECPPGFVCTNGFCRTQAMDASGVDGGTHLDPDGGDAAIDRDAMSDRPDASHDGGMSDGCVPHTCASLECGDISDGCGDFIHCGGCADPTHTCGGGGPNLCGSDPCEPQSCASQAIACGMTNNGCGEIVSCGSCGTGEHCAGGTCVPCADPLLPTTCNGSAECGPEEACIDNVCLATCGDEEALRTAVAELRNGAKAVAHFCTNIGVVTALRVDRDGCPGFDAIDLLALSPTSTETQFVLFRWPVSTLSSDPPVTTVASWNVIQPDESTYPIVARRVALSPDGRYALTGWSMRAQGELVRVDLESGAMLRSPASGVSDIVWLDDTRILALAQWTGMTPSVYWLSMTESGFSSPIRLVSEIGGLGVGIEYLAEQNTLLAGGLPPMGGWPGTTGGYRLFSIDRNLLLDASGAPNRTTALPAFSTTTVPRVSGVPAPRRVGQWLVSVSANGSAIEMRRASGTDANDLTLSSPMSVQFGRTGLFGPIGDRHIIVPYSPRSLVIRLPD